MRGVIVALLSVTLLVMRGGSAWAETVYKCKNEQGNLIYQESPCTRNVQAVSSWEAAISPASQAEELEMPSNGIYVIKQRGNGHYFLDGKINDRALTFIVDTGASSVSLPRPIAFLAHISCKEQIKVRTANGSTSACMAIIPKLRLGPFLLKEVPATIAPNLDQPLLGMNVLQQFKIEQSNGEMRISIRD